MSTEERLDELLAVWAVKVKVTLRGETKRGDWPCDEWRVTFFPLGKQPVDVEYFTGLGHRKVSAVSAATVRMEYRGSRLLKQKLDEAAKPVAPHPAKVIYSMLLDAHAYAVSFKEWCSDFGYSDDSISAFNTYQACCELALKLRSIFNREQIETLRTLLEDY